MKRQLLQLIAEPTVLQDETGLRKVGRGGWWGGVNVAERFAWRWLRGPDAGDVVTADAPKLRILATEARTLIALALDGPIPQTDIYATAGMGHGSGHTMIARLEARGWLTRTLAPRNGCSGRHTHFLALTDAGRQAMADAGVELDN
ncbi:MAG TPA: helix-turn-helix domain-containing protein [Jiangellaceae bacterium]|nr:helix-turn-helix domain-containing protein [Jiangellaceae bacterium]